MLEAVMAVMSDKLGAHQSKQESLKLIFWEIYGFEIISIIIMSCDAV